jgi:hypothetical protein
MDHLLITCIAIILFEIAINQLDLLNMLAIYLFHLNILNSHCNLNNFKELAQINFLVSNPLVNFFTKLVCYFPHVTLFIQ